MADIVISVVEKLAEYTVAPVLRQFGYLIYYKSNVEDLTQKITTLTAKRDGVQRQAEGAIGNLEPILPEVQNWFDRVNQTIQEKETCLDEGRVQKATTCCSSNGWCPNLMVRHSLSRTATKLSKEVDTLISAGNFTTISCTAPPPKPDYPAIQYFDDSNEAPAKPHQAATSSLGTSNPTNPPAPMSLSERLKYRLPYTRDLLTALQDDKVNIIGISGTIREIDTVTTKEFIKRMKQRNLFEEIVMAVVSQDPDLKRIQGEIAEMLELKLENDSLVERAERLRTVLLTSGSKRFLVILTDVLGVLDLKTIGISHADIKKRCKIMLVSQVSNGFGEMGTGNNFKLLVHSTPVARPVEFESRISVIRDVMDALTDDESNPIVVYGMGGVGKTTLVMEIGAKVGEVDLFDEIAIAEFSQEPDLIKIQGQIAKGLSLELKGEDDRAAKLRDRLSSGTKNVLLILDNVWTQLNLWDIGIPISRYPKCCKLLVSSRNQDTFKDMKTRKTIPIGGLPKHDAWSLFKKVAGASIESDLDLLPIAGQVLDECDGLPVAIATVGGALQGKSISSWRNALRELRNACPENVPGVIKDVYGKIEFSYECLPSEEAKSCFLLCCLCPESEDMPIEILVTVGIGLEIFKGINSISEGRDCVQGLVDTLKCRSLLLDIDDKECVRMHDVVRDVALYIASEESARKKNDQLKRRIVLKQGLELNHWKHRNNGIKESTHCILLTTSMSTTEFLLLGNTDKSQLKLPATIFDGMEDLKVLFIGNAILPVLPHLKKLKTLILAGVQLDFDVDVIGELHTLMILILSDSDIYQLPATFKNLSNLRHLNLNECEKLQVISPGVISSLSRLEELYMWSSFRHWEVEKLGSTETTNWISQFKFDDEPEDDVDMWKKLNRMAIEQRASTEKTTHPIKESSDQSEDETSETEEFGDVASEFFTSHMSAQKCNQLTSWAKSMDWNVGLLAELLSLGSLTTLEVVLPPVENLLTSKLFHKLERFKISIGWGNHEDWEYIEEGNYLRVHDLDASSLAGTGISLLLKKTNTLELKMKNLTDPLNVLDVNCCANLESLKLKECKSLEYLIDRTRGESSPRSVFPVLKELEIEYGDKLKEIFHGDLPSGMEKQACRGFQNLTKLQVRFCGNLRYLLSPSIARGLVKLGRLEIMSCPKMEAIVVADEDEETENNVSMFPQLYDLQLVDLPNLGSFSEGKYTFDWPLKRIIIANCNKMNKFCLGSLSISREVDITVHNSGENLEQELMESRKES